MTLRPGLPAFLVACAAWATPAAAAPVVTMTNAGPAANRLDVVILGDGYRTAEMAKFRTDAAAFAAKFLGTAPMATHRRSFNVLRIETPSVESGAGRGKPKRTVYGAYFGCFQVARLLCADESKVGAVLNANLPSVRRDIVIVLVNDPEYGGSGGPYAVASTHELSGDVAMHELGHSFGHLDDEYVDPFNCGRYKNPWGFNVTRNTTRTGAPWRTWIKAATPVPTPAGSLEVGLFQGAYFCATGWYRPTDFSMMRALGAPFGPVNSEQLIRRIHEFTNLYDAKVPSAATVRVPSGGRQTFTLRFANRGDATISVTWRLDGRVVGTEQALDLAGSALAGRSRSLTATIKATTPAVRSDPKGTLLDTVSWTVRP